MGATNHEKLRTTDLMCRGGHLTLVILIVCWLFSTLFLHIQLITAELSLKISLNLKISLVISLNSWRPAGFRDFRSRTTRLHVALHAHCSGTESGRELFKGSKDVASLPVHTRKKFFWLQGADFLLVIS